jgi:hypothetical protein
MASVKNFQILGWLAECLLVEFGLGWVCGDTNIVFEPRLGGRELTETRVCCPPRNPMITKSSDNAPAPIVSITIS